MKQPLVQKTYANVVTSITFESKSNIAMNNRRLQRIPANAVLGGVAAGVADYFQADLTLVRVIFVLLGFFTKGFPFVLIYLVLWFALPKAPVDYVYVQPTSTPNPFESMSSRNKNSNVLGGIILIVLGLIFLFDQYDIFYWIRIDKLWPIFLIIPGIYLLTKDKINPSDDSKAE
ncbi:MAG: PspC domain-containing protein [Spirosomataceae bacterium]